MKIAPVAAELFHAHRQTDGPTDRHENVKSRFASTPKMIMIREC